MVWRSPQARSACKGEAEVDKYRLIVVEDDVLGLEVTVQGPCPVQGLQALQS